MRQHTKTMTSTIRIRSGLLLGTMASAGALATTSLVSAPAANATCASLFGIGNSADCTSNLFSAALAIGTGATAHADGIFGAALSVGNTVYTTTKDAFTFATAVGDNAQAYAGGLFGIATALGPNGQAITGLLGFNLGNAAALNIALNVTPATPSSSHTQAAAQGIGNLAINLFGNGTSSTGTFSAARGIINIATNLGGTDNVTYAGQQIGVGGPVAKLNFAFDTLGRSNQVVSGPGPLAVAGSIFQTGQTITKTGPGLNINGIVVGGAAAVRSPKATTTSAAMAVRTRQKASAPTAASVGHKTR